MSLPPPSISVILRQHRTTHAGRVRLDQPKMTSVIESCRVAALEVQVAGKKNFELDISNPPSSIAGFRAGTSSWTIST